MRELRELSRKVLGAGDLQGLLQDVMDLAIAMVGADQGTLQLLEGTSLRIVAHRGHQAPFLKFFETAETVASTCWEAAKLGERVLVPDVEDSELFAGAEALAVLRAAGVRSVQSTPMMSRAGKPVGVLSTHWGKPYCPDERDLWRIDLLVRQAADLIELARAEDALRTSESTLRSFYENAPLMMGVVEVLADDSDIIHIYDNPVTDRFFDRPPGSTVGQSALGMGAPEEAVRRWIEHYRKAERESRAVQFEYWHPKKTGAVWLSAVVAKIGPGDAGRTRFSYAVADVTERKRVEEALHASEERLRLATLTIQKNAEAALREQLAHASRVSAMGELASSIIHELHQPLSAILCNIDTAELLLKQAPPALGQWREIISDIQKESQRAGEVIHGMTALLLKQETEHQPLEINLMTEEVLRLVKEEAASRKILITTELSSQLPAIRGNRVQLQQVVLNFIMNGMDAIAQQTPERRRLTVGTHLASDGGVVVSVSDLGSGIEPSNLPRLFQPFFTTKKSGLGIGLSLAEKIVTAHSGRIWAENCPTGGAVFHMVLPAANGSSSSDAKHLPPRKLPPPPEAMAGQRRRGRPVPAGLQRGRRDKGKEF